MELSKKLVALRQRKGWSQIELARAAGIPQPTICRLESGDIEQPKLNRSEERRVGKECTRLCRSRWSPYH